MGNNEPLPPPPPPAGPPSHVPPGALPPLPPGPYDQPTQQLPPTEAFPPTQVFPTGPPGGFPPHGYSPGGPVTEPPPAKKTGLFIALGLLAVAAIAAVVLLVTGGDDDNDTDVATTVVLPTVVVPTFPITIPPVTLPPDDTLVITLPTATEAPDTTASPETAAPTTTAGDTPTTSAGTPDGFVTVKDDLGVFSVALPSEFESDTGPIVTQDEFTLPSVAGADDLAAYNIDDVTRGLTVIAVGPEVDSGVDEVLTFLQPDDGVCSSSELNATYQTALGSSTMLKLDGCGTDGRGSKVIMVISLDDRNTVMGLYVQSTDTSTELLPFAQQIFESIKPL